MMQTQAPKPLQHNGFSAAKTVAAQQIQTARVFSQVKAGRTSETLGPFSLDRSRISRDSVVLQRFSRSENRCAATLFGPAEIDAGRLLEAWIPLRDKGFRAADSVAPQGVSAVTFCDGRGEHGAWS